MADTFELNPDIIQSATGTIDGDIEQIETALYGREVRASIAEALYLLENSSAHEDEIEAIKERLTTAEGEIEVIKERLTTADGQIDNADQQISDIWNAIENLNPSTATGILSQGSINGDEKNTYTLYSSGRCDIYLKGSDFETAGTYWHTGDIFEVSNVNTAVVFMCNDHATIPEMFYGLHVRNVLFTGVAYDFRVYTHSVVFGGGAFCSLYGDGNTWIESIEIDDMTSITFESGSFSGLTFLKKITYNGTIDKWLSFEKEDGWEGNMGEYFTHFEGAKQYIECVDGNLVRTVKTDSSGDTYWSDWSRESSGGSVDSITNSEIDDIFSEV